MTDSELQYVSWQQSQLRYSYLWGLGLALTAVFTVLTNSLVIVAVYKDPNRNLRNSPSNVLIASQAVADLFVGAIQEPLCIWWFASFDRMSLVFIEASSSVFMVSSILHVLVLSYDRYVAVVTPLEYTSRVTLRRTYNSIALIWCHSIVYTTYRTVLSVVYKQRTAVTIVTGLNTVFPASLGLIVYMRLHQVIRKYKRDVHNLDASGRAVVQAYRRQRKMTMVLSAAFLLFIFCTTPWFVFYQVIGACPDCEDNKDTEMYLFCAFYFLFMAKSLLNPFLYAWRLSKYRSAFRRIVPCCRISGRVSMGSANSSSVNNAAGPTSFRRTIHKEQHIQ